MCCGAVRLPAAGLIQTDRVKASSDTSVTGEVIEACEAATKFRLWPMNPGVIQFESAKPARVPVFERPELSVAVAVFGVSSNWKKPMTFEGASHTVIVVVSEPGEPPSPSASENETV